LVEASSGARSGFDDESYRMAGASVSSRPEDVYACSLIVKVKELQPQEYSLIQAGTVLFGYQQLARDSRLLDAVLASGASCIAYENVLGMDGSRPMLAPMSAIAGLMSGQIALWALQHREPPLSGSGVLIPHLPGLPRGRVLIVGEGISGSAAAGVFLNLGCHVVMLGLNPHRLAMLESQLAGCGSGTFVTRPSTAEELAARCAEADVVVGAVSVPGRLAPKLITRAMLRTMRPGSVFIDIGIDMGGIAETSRQTKLSEPIYVEEGVLHYCVPNIPALVPRTATQALAAATLPYVRILSGKGLKTALQAVPGLREGLLVHEGRIVNVGLAEDTHRDYFPFPSDRT
jgi:alanine dehydrogenase